MGDVCGVGIDLVSIQEIENLDKRTKGTFVKKTFSALEQDLALKSPNKYEFLAGRFAVKEAVYKAICSYDTEINFDFRVVETEKLSNGAPHVVLNDTLKGVMESAGITDILVSISNEKDMVLAIANIMK